MCRKLPTGHGRCRGLAKMLILSTSFHGSVFKNSPFSYTLLGPVP